MTTPRKRVTLADIAAETGYTINTVSRALKDMPDISRATCGHIQQVADRMGYVRNYMACSLRSGRTRTIGVIVGGMANPFYSVMVDSVYDYAESIGYTILVMCSRDDPQQEEKVVTAALERQADGVLLYPSAGAARSAALMRQAGVPFVMVSRKIEGVDCDCVVCDGEQGGYLAAKHLIETGHRKLGYYYSYEVVYSSEKRRGGFRRAARELGVPESDLYEHHYQGDEEALKCLRRWKAEGVTGIFTFCDMEALLLHSLLERSGMSGDFAIVGFDNIQRMVGYPTPMCTIDGSVVVFAWLAMPRVVRRILGVDCSARTEVFPGCLVCTGNCER